jgi:hypothetical protein
MFYTFTDYLFFYVKRVLIGLLIGASALILLYFLLPKNSSGLEVKTQVIQFKQGIQKCGN